MKETSAYNTPERNTRPRDNPALLPPPRKPVSAKDRGTVPIRGRGTAPTKGGTQGSYPRYRSAEALEYAINLYFDKKTAEGKPFTMAGLAMSLGFKSAKRLKAYEERGEEFAGVVEVARSRVEEAKNELLLEGGRATNGVIFDLKNNHQWADKTETKSTLDVTGTLAELLASLQGSVLRPVLVQESEEEIAEGIYAEQFEEELAAEYDSQSHSPDQEPDEVTDEEESGGNDGEEDWPDPHATDDDWKDDVFPLGDPEDYVDIEDLV